MAMVTAGVGVIVTVADDGSDVTAGPVGGVPDTVAVLAMLPASTSACVATYVAVHVVEAAGANVVTGQVTVNAGPAGAVRTSVTVMAVRVTLPVLVTTNSYATLSPLSLIHI